MNKTLPKRSAGWLIVALSFPFAFQSFGVLIHNYELDSSFADSLGGPSLVANGGTINATDYSFGPNQGLTLSNAFPNPANYSILVDFSLSTLSGYRRLVDFKNGTSDNGLYNLNSALNFYPITTGAAVFAPDVPVRLILTRNSATDLFTGYINGSQQISFTDGGHLSVFDASNVIMKLFIDDNLVGNEASAGRVSKIAIYDSPLTPTQVLALASPPPPAVPEPGSALFGLATLAICLGKRSRRRVLAS